MYQSLASTAELAGTSAIFQEQPEARGGAAGERSNTNTRRALSHRTTRRGLRVTSAWAGLFVVLISMQLAVFAQAKRLNAPAIQAHLRRARADLTARQPQAAAAELRAVLVLDPENADALVNLGVIAFFQRDCPVASRDFQRALAVRPVIPEAKALWGICELRSGNRDGSTLLRSAYPDLKDKKLRVDVGLALADFYYQRGDLERASALVESLVKLDPDNVNVLYVAQKVYADLSDEIVNKLAVEAPSSARMQEVIAERLINDGNVQAAIEHYREALTIDPHLAGLHFELAEAILQLHSASEQARKEAEDEIERARSMEGDNAGIECQLGRIALLQSELVEAYDHYRHAFQMNPGSSEAQLGLGSVLMKMQKPQAALKYLRLAAASDPLNSDAHYELAIDYRDLQMTTQAEKEMQLFQEIQHTMDRVRTLYRQMNRREEPENGALPRTPQ